MKICYLDESGHCGEKKDPEQQIETVVGVITDISRLFKTQKEHGNIIEIFKEAGIESSELKAQEIYKGRKEWSGIKEETRYEIYELLLKWAITRKSKFVVCPIDSHRFFELKENKHKLALKFGYPYEAAAFNSILAVQREYNGTKNNKGRTVMIFDEQKKHDKRLTTLLESDLGFTDTFTKYVVPPRKKPDPRFDQIVDIPHFSKSHMTVIIQIADIAAYVVNRHLQIENSIGSKPRNGEQEKISSWYSLIGKNMINHTSIDPPGKDDELIDFYRDIRPFSWKASEMKKH